MMTTRRDVILRELRSSYGSGKMVEALADWLDANPDRWGDDNALTSRPDDLALIIWEWFSGGDTAALTAARIRNNLEGL